MLDDLIVVRILFFVESFEQSLLWLVLLDDVKIVFIQKIVVLVVFFVLLFATLLLLEQLLGSDLLLVDFFIIRNEIFVHTVDLVIVVLVVLKVLDAVRVRNVLFLGLSKK